MVDSPVPSRKRKRSRQDRRRTCKEGTLQPLQLDRVSKKTKKSKKSDRFTSSKRSRSTKAVPSSADGGNVVKAKHRLTPNAIEVLVTAGASESIIDERNHENDDQKTTKNTTSHTFAPEETATAQSRPLVLRLRVGEVGKNASEWMNQEEDEENDGSGMMATVFDDKYSLEVILVNSPPIVVRQHRVSSQGDKAREYAMQDYIISVDGFATTGGCNSKYHLAPIVCLASFHILSTWERTASPDLPPFTIAKQKDEKAHCGNAGTFLAQTCAFFTNEELLGSAQLFQPSRSTTDVGENMKQTQKFTSRHTAMVTLKNSSAADSSSSLALSSSILSSPPAKRPTEQALELYNSALREFTFSQMDRQRASLGTNTGKETADRANLVAERHNATLELAMQETNPLSIGLLCSWHKELLRDIDPGAGQLRSKSARAGNAVFAHPSSIRSQLELYCNGLQSLEKRLDLKHNARHAVLFAAAAMYGLVDIHPFADGNGRLSRIVCNWALRQLPFPINLFATASQRAEYVTALETTRHCLSLTCVHGRVSRDDILRATKHTGIFSPIVHLLMDRVARTTLEWERLWEEKNGLAAEAAEAQAARRVRERAARGTCMICLEEKPNIATLCCGKPSHLNCIAEWLSQQTTCPICRSEMPAISGRVVRAASSGEPGRNIHGERHEEGHEDEDDRSTTSSAGSTGVNNWNRRSERFREFFEETWRHDGVRNLWQAHPSTTTTTTTSEEDDEDNGEEDHETTRRMLRQEQQEQESQSSSRDESIETTESESETFDTTTSSEDGGATSDPTDSSSNTASDEQHADTATVLNGGMTTSGTESSQPAQHRHSPRVASCSSRTCRNRAAFDCANSLCGRCCVLVGEFHCPRHNS